MVALRSAVFLVVAGCGWLTHEADPTHLEDTLTVVHQGPGFALRVPEGARVTHEPRGLAVDAAEGTWWYDVRRVRAPVVPVASARAWAAELCPSVRWDKPTEPAEGVFTLGGMCQIAGRRHWVQAVVETHGDEALLFGLAGRVGGITYEDLWVALTESALSLAPGDAPQALGDTAALRAEMRAVELDEATLMPVPGGGVFSTVIAQRLAERLAAHRTAGRPAPDALVGPKSEGTVP